MTEPELNFETVADSRQLDELYTELCYCAYEVLVLHPGCGKVEWMDTLLHDYHTEVVDVYGWSEKMQEDGLSKLWYEDYTDTATNQQLTYAQWSAKFQSEGTTQYFNEIQSMTNQAKENNPKTQ